MAVRDANAGEIESGVAGDTVDTFCVGYVDLATLKARIDVGVRPSENEHMNIAQIEDAVHRGVPFKLKVADGDEYPVPHPDYIFLPPRAADKRTYVMVHNDAGFASILPLLTITSLTFQVDAGK